MKKCKLHKRYQGKNPPNRECYDCWELYYENNPNSKYTLEKYKMKCKDHPRYTGKRKPNNLCIACWRYYNKLNPKSNTLAEHKLKLKQKKKRKDKRKRNKKKNENKKQYKKLVKWYKKNISKEIQLIQYNKKTYNFNKIPELNFIENVNFQFYMYKEPELKEIYKIYNKVDNKVILDVWYTILKQVFKNDLDFLELLNKNYSNKMAFKDYKKYVKIKYNDNSKFDFNKFKQEKIKCLKN